MSGNYRVGDLVFFYHPKHSWVVGNIISEDKGTFSCKVTDPKRTEVPQGDIEKVKESGITNLRDDLLGENVHDLLSLTILHDATLLRCLYIRYMEDIVYTNIGAIVVAFNPFNFKIPHYMDDRMGEYLKEGATIERNIPHSWAQAHNTYNEMLSDRQDQCVLISGESGAGKTEATKIVMKYLANISTMKGSDEERKESEQVGKRLADCSPVLESFGNAKTVRNDNSSRFGKFMKVKFNSSGLLSGAFVVKYLLEKSRIVQCGPGERVYHAFYMVCRGKFKGQFKMKADTDYKQLGAVLHNKDFDTPEEFAMVCDAMVTVGMSQEEIVSIWAATAGCMPMVNGDFIPDGEGSKPDPTKEAEIDHAMNLWQVNPTDLKKELCETTLEIKGSKTLKKLSVTSARDIRDALVKSVYDNTFNWLVEKCNNMCDSSDSSGNYIGLLDIFGFEDFEHNTFEQICINLTNETLQNHYNTFIFTKDMEECRNEGIDVAAVECPDNMPCLKMVDASAGIGKPKAKVPGILQLLDSECSLKGDDFAFLASIESQHGKNPFFFKKKTSKDTFGVHHYAGSVTYDIHGWCEKNRDTLKDAIKLIMRASADPLIKTLLPEPVEKIGKALTVGGFFANQVRELLGVIESTNPHWIRCIKPHPAKQPRKFDGIQSMNQLESSGVLGTVKIRKAGYPVRLPHDKFLKRYQIMTGPRGGTDETVQAILAMAGLDDKKYAQNGKTKVFLKSEAYPMLERKRAESLLKFVQTFQFVGKGFLGRHECFALFVEKHRERLLREKAEREEREREERERLEAERKAEEERQRKLMEEERARREAEARRLFSLHNRSAITMQKVIRGGLTRLRVYRETVESLRAQYEASVEDRAWRERMEMITVDCRRQDVERQWVHHLKMRENINKFEEHQETRTSSREIQKKRIEERQALFRLQNRCKELGHEELFERKLIIQKRDNFIEDASKKREMMENTLKTVAQARERRLRREQGVQMQGGKFTIDEALDHSSRHFHRSQKADQRAQDTMVSFAAQRARAFDEYGDRAPPPMADARSRAQGWDQYQRGTAAKIGLGNDSNRRATFEHNIRRWERQEVVDDIRDAALAQDYVHRHLIDDLAAEQGTAEGELARYQDDRYSGPYQARPSGAAMGASRAPRAETSFGGSHIVTPVVPSALHSPPDTYSPHNARGSYRDPQQRSIHSAAKQYSGRTPQQIREAMSLRPQADWDAVFNTPSPYHGGR